MFGGALRPNYPIFRAYDLGTRRHIEAMAYLYVLMYEAEHVFTLKRSKGPIDATIEQLSRENRCRLTEFASVATEDDAACEAFLHHQLRSKRVVRGEGTEFFQINPAELDLAISQAREFVAEFLVAKKKAEELARTEADACFPAVQPSSADLVIYWRLLRVRAAQDHLAIQRDYFESKLKLSIGHALALDGVATWKGQRRRSFDVAAFRAGEPQVYAAMDRRFGTESYSRTFRIQRPT